MGLVDTEVDPKRSGQWSTQGYCVHLRQGTARAVEHHIVRDGDCSLNNLAVAGSDMGMGWVEVENNFS